MAEWFLQTIKSQRVSLDVLLKHPPLSHRQAHHLGPLYSDPGHHSPFQNTSPSIWNSGLGISYLGLSVSLLTTTSREINPIHSRSHRTYSYNLAYCNVKQHNYWNQLDLKPAYLILELVLDPVVEPVLDWRFIHASPKDIRTLLGLQITNTSFQRECLRADPPWARSRSQPILAFMLLVRSTVRTLIIKDHSSFNMGTLHHCIPCTINKRCYNR